MRRLALLLALSLCATLLGCLPDLRSLEPPRLDYLPAASGLLRLDPPGVGAGEAVFALAFEVYNPNPYRLRLERLEAEVLIGEVSPAPAARSALTGGALVGALGRERLALELRLPLLPDSPVLSELNALLSGEALDLRLEGFPVLAFGQLEQALSPRTLLATRLRGPFLPEPPRLALEPGSGLREASAESAVYELVLRAENPGPIGYRWRAEALELRLAGEPVAALPSFAADLPAGSSALLRIPFELPRAALATLEPAAPGQNGLSLSLLGGVDLELPGLRVLELPVGVLVSGRLE